jgi:PAS domain S-box-containing protein
MSSKPTYEELERKINELEKQAAERKGTEETVRDREERYRILISEMLNGFALHEILVDNNGKPYDYRFLEVNKAFEDMTGLQGVNVVGRTVLEVLPRLEPYWIETYGEVVLTGKSVRFENYSQELGKHYEVLAYSPQEGQFATVFTDITERVRSEEELIRITKAVESSSEAVEMSDPQGHHFYQNKRFTDLFEYATAEELEGAGGGYVAYANQAVARDVFDTIMAGKSWVGETEMVSKSGRKFPVLLRADAIKDDVGNIIGLVGVHTDMTERKWAQEEKEKLEAQLQHSQRMEAIGTLAGGIAHDFNNLLTGVQGNVSLMLMNIDSTHPHHERLKNIEKQVESGAKLTSHLLGYARKGKYEIMPFDLNKLVEETSETFSRTRKQLQIHIDLVSDLYAIEADAGQIEQVILNLLVNSADAMSGGGDLFLKTTNVTHNDMKKKLYEPKSGDYIMLTVTDTGTGMEKETIERIFDPFFTTKEMGRGTGLGLASAYGIIKAHGGYIDVESKKGQGTTFSIYLPASEKEVQKVARTAEQVIEGTGMILLVDDEDVILEVGQDLLEAMGYQVFIAKDGKEAIEIYEKNRDDIGMVVLDMVMPNMGGGEAYDGMKKINPDIKVLLSSGYSIDGEATEILERGCDAFIQKPFKMRELSQAITKILGKK